MGTEVILDLRVTHAQLRNIVIEDPTIFRGLENTSEPCGDEK